jgi:hypothetical protein
MDPVTIAAGAATAYSAVRKAIMAGQELEQMIGSVSKWVSCVSDLDQLEREAKNPPIFKKLFGGQSVEAEAIQVFAAKRKAESDRRELLNYIGLTLGKSAVDDLIRLEGRIRKKRQETLYAQRESRRKFIEIVAWTITIGAGLAVLTAFVLLLKAHTAQAQAANDLTVCRLVKCMKIDKDTTACVYRGAHNTQETMMFSPREFRPREYLCQWDIDQPPPPDIYETLKGIRDSRN